MPATTARGFRYPLNADDPNIERDMGNLATDIDGQYVTTTAATRPAASKAGRKHRASDTGEVSLDTGTAWVDLVNPDNVGVERAAGVLRLKDGGVTAAKIAAALKPSGGAAAATEALRALGTAAGTAAAGDDSRITGALQKNAAAGDVLTFGGDNTNLYRSAIDTLKTNGSFHARGITVDPGGATQIRIGNAGGAAPIIYFGTAEDTSLYRGDTDRLQTDDSLRVTGTLSLADGNYTLAGLAPGNMVLGSAGPYIFNVASAEAMRIAGGVGGQVFATSGPENLRIIRGSFNGSTLAITRGSGFTIARTPGGASAGDYRITFSTAYPSAPTVQVNTEGSTSVSQPFNVGTATFDVVVAGSTNQSINFTVTGPR